MADTPPPWLPSLVELIETVIEATRGNVSPTDDERIAAAVLAEREACAKIAEGWLTQPRAGGEYQTDGNRFWDAGTVYDQGRVDAAAAIRAKNEKG